MPSSVDFEHYFFWSDLTQTIRFSARHLDKRIRCGVTRMALEDRAGAPQSLRPADLERVFEQYRQEIERIAADKILAGSFQGDGTIVIRAVDISP
jgi:uncharacterized protein DUF1488